MGQLVIDRAELYRELGFVQISVIVGIHRFRPSFDTLQTILDDVINQASDTLIKQWPWLDKLSEPRQRAVVWLSLWCNYTGHSFPVSIMHDLERRCYHCAAQHLRSLPFVLSFGPRLIDLLE